MAASHDLGRRGEELAARALERAGWRVLHRNFLLGHKEIDLVAQRGETIAFVEVKTRAGSSCGHPLEAVTAAKRREIETVARAWVARHGRAADIYRFDAVSIIWDRGVAELEHIEDAWRPAG